MFDGTVATSSGRVRGVEGDGCWTFLGIPYAAPVSGRRRFAPPAPAEPWEGLLVADRPTPIAPQPQSGIGSYLPGDPMEQGEDCLSLNVFAPPPDGTLRPVLCFFHGGAFLSGTGAGVMYRGEHFARKGVLVVTVNYRLGFLGFLAHPRLDVPGGMFANRGMLDQVAAIGWVCENIEHFGGDPGNITLAGESAGAMSIADLMASGVLKGRIRRAVLESGSVLVSSRKRAFATAERFADLLGMTEVDAEVLASVPLTDLLGAQDQIIREGGGAANMPFRPIVDGELLTDHPAALIASGASAGMDLLVGTNRDEFRLFTFAQDELTNLDEDGLTSIVRGYLRGAGVEVTAEEVIDCYRTAHAEVGRELSARAVFEAIGTDLVFRLPLIRLASTHARGGGRVFFYRFDWTSPFAQGALGACHALELPFVFGTLDNPIIGLFSGTGDLADALAQEMQSAWVGFARDGDPSSAERPWPAYEESNRTTRVFGGDVATVDAPGEMERAFLEPHFARLGSDGE